MSRVCPMKRKRRHKILSRNRVLPRCRILQKRRIPRKRSNRRKKKVPLPTDFYRPTPGQSEYSYLFGEQEEIDPYDYVMEKVQNRKKTRLPQQEQQEPSEPGAEKATERKPAKPRPTVERDLSLEKPAGEEKKSLRESFSELLRWVTRRPAGRRRDCANGKKRKAGKRKN